jgi:hypothetical protein
MINELQLIGAVSTLGFFYVLLPIAWSEYHRYAHRLALSCPETGLQTVVHIDPYLAMRTSLIGEPKLSVRDCARWPKMKNCAQNCLGEAGSG